MNSQECLPERSAMQEKAIKKFPFTLNNQTYFSTQCFYNDTIINGVSLQVKQAKGISNSLSTIAYLNYSNRLVVSAGCNILTYNTYKQKYQVIAQCSNLLCLKAYSISTIQKEYIVWVEKMGQGAAGEDGDGGRGYLYTLCVFDMNAKQKIYCEKFGAMGKELRGDQVEIVMFMHPVKLIGLMIYDFAQQKTQIVYKKMAKPNQQSQFGPESQQAFPYLLKSLKYDLQSNSYFFIAPTQQIKSLQCSIGPIHDCQPSNHSNNPQHNRNHSNDNNHNDNNKALYIDKLININGKGSHNGKKIVHFAINQSYLLVLTCNERNERQLEFYSIYSYMLIFVYPLWIPFGQIVPANNICGEDEEQSKELVPIDYIEFNKGVIIGLRGNSTSISIFSLHEQNLKHLRDATLNLTNCYKLEGVFINPFSSEVMVLSRHYEIEGSISTMQRSTKAITKTEAKYKNFYLDVSTFFITMEASHIDVHKMSLQRRNYYNILTAPWLSQFLIQTQNSIKSKKWQQKFDCIIKCSAVHPTGQYVALGFNDCFKIYFSTYQGFIYTFVSQNVKECLSLCYSKSGNDFAVATVCNIFVYDCYNYEKKNQICLGASYRIQEISYIDGFQNGKKKQCLQCITSTKRIVIYNANLNYAQCFSFNPKTQFQTSILENIFMMVQPKEAKQGHQANFPDFMNTGFLGATNPVKTGESRKGVGAILFDDKIGIVIFTLATKIYFISSRNFQMLGCFDFQEVSCMQLCRELRTLFFGTVNGKIMAFPWPNKPVNITSKMPTFWCHKSRIKRIKVTSNLFELVSITEQSIYIHSIHFIQEMRRIQKYQLQRECHPQSLLSIDMLLRVGVCLFTGEQFDQKCENIKENQQEAVNIVFMLPEEREKQKLTMLSRLQKQKQRKALETQEEGLPLKIDAMTMKQKIKNLQKESKSCKAQFDSLKQKQLQAYHREMSELSKKRDSLRIEHTQLVKRLEKEMLTVIQEQKVDVIKAETVAQMKLEQASRQANDADYERIRNLNNFHELKEMDEETKIMSKNIIAQIESDISVFLQRNGYLSCRNTNLQKDISTKKRKIEDIKQLIHSTERGIKALPKKSRIQLKPQNIKQQAQINKQFSDTEKQYLKETKKLIEKNKAINVSIELYERQREMLVILENQLQKSSKNIDNILDYIMKEREQKKKIKVKLDIVADKAKKIVKLYQAKNAYRIKVKNILKQYLFQITMYQQGIIDKEKLRKLSQIRPEDMLNPPQNISLSIEEKKKKIEKIQSAEEKVMNVMKNQRKIYSNQRRKTCTHNQDLLVNFNFLLHENKHLLNMMKDQKEKKKYCIKNITKRDNKKLTSRPTPFSSYLALKNNSKSMRRMKTSPCAQYDLSP